MEIPIHELGNFVTIKNPDTERRPWSQIDRTRRWISKGLCRQNETKMIIWIVYKIHIIISFDRT